MQSEALLQIGPDPETRRHNDDDRMRGKDESIEHAPSEGTIVYDTHVIVGGRLDLEGHQAQTQPLVDTAFMVNADNTIIDNAWIWRADHGPHAKTYGKCGYCVNTGVKIKGDNVRTYGLFLEHVCGAHMDWAGADGAAYFLQTDQPPEDLNSCFGQKQTSQTSVWHVTGANHKAYGLGIYTLGRPAGEHELEQAVWAGKMDSVFPGLVYWRNDAGARSPESNPQSCDVNCVGGVPGNPYLGNGLCQRVGYYAEGCGTNVSTSLVWFV